MRLIILKGDAPRHNYFAKSLCEIKGIDTAVITPDRFNHLRLWRMLKKSPKTFFARVSKYCIFKFMHWNDREKKFFGNDYSFVEHRVPNINSNEAKEIVKKFKPDLIACFGVPIVCDEIIKFPKFGSINLHGGISPQYKGGNTIFWPIYEGKPDMAGATIHEMVTKVDSGKYFAKIYPDLNPSDDECSASCKTFFSSIQEFVKLVEWIRDHNTKPIGKNQEGESRLYKASQRTMLISLLGIIKIKKNLHSISLPTRIERTYEL